MSGRSRAVDWWRRALTDGKDCEKRGRERYYADYLAEAESVLLPGPLIGPFELLYRMGFREGYDNSLLQRKRESQYFTRPKKRVRA